MSEEENQEIDDTKDPGKVTPSVWAQVRSKVIVALVLLALWGVFEGLPIAGDWLGGKAEAVVESVDDPDIIEETPGSEPDTPGGVTAAASPEEKPAAAPGSLAFYRQQIEEQLGGAEAVDVRHLALSDDGTKMVAALKTGNLSYGSELLEVFFEKDEFGRFLSTKDSPVESPLKLWPE